MAIEAALEKRSNTERGEGAQCEGLIFDIKRYAVHDGPGLRTVVFLKGCSLSCAWCHNPESISPRPEVSLHPERCIACFTCVKVCPNQVHQFGEGGEHVLERDRCKQCGTCTESCYAEALVMVGKKLSVGQVMEVLNEDRAFYEASGGGVTLSGGEPFMQAEFTTALLQSCKAAGLHTAVDTCGNVPWAVIQKTLPYIDLALYDLKHMDPGEHKRHAGATNDLALRNLRRLSKSGVPIEIRIPLIPTVNDSPAHVEAIGRFLASLDNIVGVRLLPYLRLAGSKYASIGRPNRMPEVDTPTREHLETVAGWMQRDRPLTIFINA
ncbi:MAG: glycyl-radical enzyme activating protein [Chloroflexi bacterium]|nr:glycyl-radical enzyme activating protein [Chloroflexota bacterium]MCL5026002.1 glycyl-radical enzyme activating protein [Chloroflexota bacterium]